MLLKLNIKYLPFLFLVVFSIATSPLIAAELKHKINITPPPESEIAKQEKLIRASTNPIYTYQSYGETSVRELEYLNFLLGQNYREFIAELTLAKYIYLSPSKGVDSKIQRKNWEQFVGGSLATGVADEYATFVLTQTTNLFEFILHHMEKKQATSVMGYYCDFDGESVFSPEFYGDMKQINEIVALEKSIAKNNAIAAKNNAESERLKASIAKNNAESERLKASIAKNNAIAAKNNAEAEKFKRQTEALERVLGIIKD